MAQWRGLSLMAVILLAVWGCGKSSAMEGPGAKSFRPQAF
jgi:hypothetical protein